MIDQKQGVAVVTGAGSGIGLAIARHLKNEGYVVYNLSRHQGQATDIRFYPCDVTRKEQVKAALAHVIKEQGRISILVCGAGMGISGAVEFISEEDEKRQMEVNLMGAMRCARLAAPYMREQGEGKILFLSSLAAVFPIPFQAHYAAGKAAINVFSDALGMELRRFSVQCSCLIIGDVKTGFTAARRKNQTGDQLYGGAIGRSVARMEHDEENGMSPEVVAKVVIRTLRRRRMPSQRPVGAGCMFLYQLLRFLPHRMVLSLLYRLYAR